MPCQGKWQDRSLSTVVPNGKVIKLNLHFRNIEEVVVTPGKPYQK